MKRKSTTLLTIFLLAANLFAARPVAAFINLDLPWYTPCLIPFIYIYDTVRVRPKEKVSVGGNEFVFYRQLLWIYQRNLPGFSGPAVMSGELARTARAKVGGNDFVFARGEFVRFYYDGTVKEARLAGVARVKCGGNVIPLEHRKMNETDHEAILFFGNGAVEQGLLARDTRVRIGGYPAVLAEGSTKNHVVLFYPNGGIRKAMLAADADLRAGERTFRFKGSTVAEFYPGGMVKRGNLATSVAKEESGVGMMLPAGSFIELDVSGRVRGVVLAGPATADVHGVTVEAPAEGRIDFYRSGKVSGVRLTEPRDVEYRGWKVFAERYGDAGFHDNGRVKRASFEKRSLHTAGGRVMSCRPGVVFFHYNGSLAEAYVEGPFTARVKGGSLSFQGGRVKFHDNGAIECGIPEGRDDIDLLAKLYGVGISNGRGSVRFHRNGALRLAYLYNDHADTRYRVKGVTVVPDSGRIGFHDNGHPSFFKLRKEALLPVNGKRTRIPAGAGLMLTPSGEVFGVRDDREKYYSACVMNGRPVFTEFRPYIKFLDRDGRVADALAFEGIHDLHYWSRRPLMLVFDNAVVDLDDWGDINDEDDVAGFIWVRYEDFHSYRVKSVLFGRERYGAVNGKATRFPAFRWVDVVMAEK